MIVKLKDILRMVLQPVREYISIGKLYIQRKICKSKPNGYGIHKHVTQSNYEGYWANEKQEGYGIKKWKDGAIYKGQFYNGK